MSDRPITGTTLGVLQLANTAFVEPGFVSHPDVWPYPILCKPVEGAYVRRICQSDPELARAYASAARSLQSEGVSAVLSNCGLTVLYQDAMTTAVDIPVISSSLLALPMLSSMIPGTERIGILTYDSELIDDVLIERCGGDPARTIVAGLNGSEAFELLGRTNPPLQWSVIRRDLFDAADDLLRRQPNAILIECTTYCPFVDELRQRCGIPVFDYVWLAKSWLEGRFTRT